MCIAWFWAILRYTYEAQISPVYEYAGLRVHEHPLWVDFSLLVLTLAVGAALPLSGKRASDWAVMLLFMSLVVPVTSLWPVMLDLEPGTLIGWGILLVAGFVVLALSASWVRVPVRGFDLLPGSTKLFWPLIGLALLLGTCGVMQLTGWRLHLDWESQYERRLETRDVVRDGTAIAYLLAVLKSFLLPLGAVGFFAFKRRLLVLPVLLTVLAIFSLDGSKAVLFTPLALGLISIVMHAAESRRIPWFAACFPIVATAAALESEWLGSDWLDAIFVRRVFVLPAELTWAHFDWLFSEGPRWFAGSRLGGFWGTSGEEASPMLIGWTYLNNADSNANANIWASGAVELGVPGVIMAGLLAGCILGYINTVRGGANTSLRALGAIWCGFIWTQQALHTSLISSGLAFFCILLLVAPELDQGKNRLSKPSSGQGVHADGLA
jgi:hypothetical protein